eukprot:TRINITY_DN18193_c0_g1_i1.p1 TRINITY_DN18193_c0_g1~~TRINITY_DN18193_c0_g1_i1.p1  ORF type:complete len:324 (-),score=44.32 TRINITY_DN18193_c0_g1_i1:136-1107(-)
MVDYDITVCSLQDVRDSLKELRIKRLSDNNSFEREFNKIEENTHNNDFNKVDFVSARKPDNRIKNRYTNVLPVEITRVKLKDTHEIDSNANYGDYINANYINGEIEGSKKAYIAAQGPLEETCIDFWRMVWTEHSNVIVMLTKLVENDRCKCHKYWPKKREHKWHSYVKVTRECLTTDKDSPEITIRKFELEHEKTGEKRKLTHFQYREWPDHGLPENTVHFRELLKMVDQQNLHQGPVIVHCSAGIGRSGTFCAVDSTMKKILQQRERKEPIHFNIFNTVLRLRKERPGMVQTKEQYIFCYLALYEELEEIMIQNHPTHNGV